MLRVSTKPRKRNSPRIAEKSAPGFLQYLRGRGCVFAGSFWLGPCGGKTEAMHLDFAGGKGMGTKVADSFCIPGCSVHHKRQTDKGWITFIKEARTSKQELLAAADTFWRTWPGRIAWERKLEERNG